MEGINVVELGFWVAGPSCAAMLADWGADVVKVEPLDRRSVPGHDRLLRGGDRQGLNPPFELDNRGKRSIGLDYGTRRGRARARRTRRRRRRVRHEPARRRPRAGRARPRHAAASHPRLVYASVTGLGLEGDERDRAAYDVGSFWSSRGRGQALTPEGCELPYQRGGMGDHMTGMAAAGAVAAALARRGSAPAQGQLVTTSLLRIGVYMMGWDMSINLRTGLPTVADDPSHRTQPADPRLQRRRRPPVLAARTAGRSPLAGRAAGRRADRSWPTIPASPSCSIGPSTPAELVEELGDVVRGAAAGGVGRDLRPRGRVVGAGAGHARVRRRSAGGGGRRLRAAATADGGAGPDRGDAGRLRGRRLVGAGVGAGVRPAHRGGAARARLRLGRHHRAEGAGAVT